MLYLGFIETTDGGRADNQGQLAAVAEKEAPT
jgi:hypothetical protein